MSLTTRQIEDLLKTKLDDLDLFALIENLAAVDFRTVETLPAALVAMTEDDASGSPNSRLVTIETYTITIVARKGERNSLFYPSSLCDAVRDAINGHHYEYDELEPFRYQGRTLIDYEAQNIAYALKFQCTHILGVAPMT